MRQNEDRPIIVALNHLLQKTSSDDLKLDSMGIGALNTAKACLEWLLKLVVKEINKRKRPANHKR